MKNHILMSVILFSLISTQGFAESVTSITGAKFIEQLSSLLGERTKIVGKNNGPSGQLCTIEISKGQGRSSNFQTTLKITETDVFGKNKLPVQINILHSQTGYYGFVSTSEEHIQRFQFTFANISNAVTVAKTGQMVALQLQSSVPGKTISGYCFVPVFRK